mmetsp:Transcript_27805/g.36249  ORF Transcript_27805/g.36249 Transcript_27805/m.36249 type:complete len:141 (+) Transcript_27805:586-1008(+)
MEKLKSEPTLVFQLFMQMSSAPNKPGDIISDKIKEAMTAIHHHNTMKAEANIQGQGPTENLGASLWGDLSSLNTSTASSQHPPHTPTIPPQVENSEFNKTLNRILALEKSFHNIKNNLDGDSIEVAGRMFESCDQTEVWL